MKIGVTGAGFIGGYVVERLNRDGHEVVVFDHQNAFKGDAEVFIGDIRDATAVTEFFSHVDAVIHLAGILGSAEAVSNPRPAIDTNINGGINVLEAAAQYRLPVVMITVGNFFEKNTYSLTKTCVEGFSQMYRDYRGVTVSVVRALNAYGPRQSVAQPFGSSQVRKIMPSFVCRALTGHDIELYGKDGKSDQVMDMIYVSDIADTLVDTLYYTMENGSVGSILEAGTGRDTTVDDIANEVVRQIGKGNIVHLPMRQGEKPSSVVLGHPETLDILGKDYARNFVTLENGIAVTVDYYRTYLKDTGQL